MRKNWLIDRRTCLKGLGVALALPLLETMGWAETPKKSGGYKAPVRLGWMFMPCGVNQETFWPKDEKDWAANLSPALQSLRPFFDNILLLDGINNEVGFGAPHAIELCSWLTAEAPNRDKRDQINIAPSADQIAAAHLGLYTALPSLELACKPDGPGSEIRQEGLTNRYYQTVSFRTATQPLPMERSPAEVYKRLFASRQSTPKKKGGPSVDAKQFSAPGGAADDESSLDRSMLDQVRENAGELRSRISVDDQHQLDDYLDSVRSLEKRVGAIERQQSEAAKENAAGGTSKGPASIPRSPPLDVKVPAGSVKWQEHVKVMGDLMILAFQSDITRVGTLIPSHDHGISYEEFGYQNHHYVSHHEKRTKKDFLEVISKIDRLNIDLFAYLVGRMKSLKEGSGTLLDNVIFTWGAGLGDGDSHTMKRLPTVIAGGGGGTIRSGRYVPNVKGHQGDLLTGILARAGVPMSKPVGRGTKMLAELS